MTGPVIDLNADLGESFGVWVLGDDDAVLRRVSSANVACGFHAGDPATMWRTCRAAVQAGVSIGAHVAYRDLAGFGRRFLAVERADLAADLVYQIGALAGIAGAVGGRVGYLKPHGALYHAAARDPEHAGAVLDAALAHDPPLPVLVPPGSELADLAVQRSVPTIVEAFVDRGYRPDGSLVPRGEPGALLADPALIADRAVRMVLDGTVGDVTGRSVPIEAGSLCLHGDSPGAVAIADAVRAALDAAGVTVRPFVAP